MIKHTVFFKLKHEAGSTAEESFLDKARALSTISTIQSFVLVKEISPKNNFTHGLVVEFEDQAGYDFYNQHSSHSQFVKEVWIPEVEEFLEIDYVE